MGSNRKRPFGYKMELGEIVLHPAEAETVRWLYDSYLAGASYNALVDKLRERGISRSEEHTSELQSPTHISYAVFCLKKKFF